ncbi:primosomal protein N' [Litoribrevibacter euphylliae]|uniref:Replication restart protein PriA n=1 Tax=Litoribrevibacter euphylliae TaxID=1834034 RepID=A0ABV7HHX0_9GAMM
MAVQNDLQLQETHPLHYYEVAVNRPLFQTYTYASFQPISLGCRVQVKLGHSTEVGIVVAQSTKAPDSDFTITTIDKIIDPTPILSAEILTLCHWGSSYYFQPLGEFIFTFIPNYLKQAKLLESLYIEAFEITSKGKYAKLPSQAIKQSDALATIQTLATTSNSNLVAKTTLNQHDIKSDTLRQLLKKELIQKSLIPPYAYTTAPTQTNENSLTLNQEQSDAVSTVIKNQNTFKSILLEGVTGSGKTEVYLNICRHFLNQGQQVLLLVPEIGLTPQLSERLQTQLPYPMITLHSDLANKERASRWLQTKHSTSLVVIGTRSAIACDLPKLACIILDEEHDSSFKQQEGIRYHSRSLAIKRAQLKSIPILLGSATPSLETLTNAEQGRYQHLRLTKRATGANLPEIEIQDSSRLTANQVFTDSTSEAIRNTLQKQQQVLVFINRRGFAPTLQCSQCHWVADCEHCDVALTIHKATNSLDCHHCEHKQPIPRRCPSCNSPYMSPLGFGTERIESELIQHFPDHPIIRMDRDSTQNRGSLEKIRQTLLEGTPCILVGTQMVSKGHDFPNLTLSVVLNCDNGLHNQDFRSKEHLLQNLIQVAGRSGRSKLQGQVIIQTNYPDHPLFVHFKEQDFPGFAKEELTHRKKLGLPPFHHQAAIRMQSLMDNQAFQKLLSLEKYLKDCVYAQGNQNLDISLTMPAAIERKSNWYRYLIVVSSPSRKHLHQYLNIAHEYLLKIPRTKKLKWVIDVDPLDT